MEQFVTQKVKMSLKLIQHGDGVKPDMKLTCLMTNLGYRLEELLGKGEIAQVRKAKWMKKNKEVAIKFIPKFKACEEYYNRYLPRELSALETLKGHPFIVDLLSVYESPRAYYLIFDYLPMGNMLIYVNRRGFLSEVESRKFFSQLVDAVGYCHQQKIAHRDIKLDNILLDEFFNIRLCDFGFAALLKESSHCHSDCGSMLYVAPEVFAYSSRKSYDGTKADIWSMGICLYAMLCGKLPFTIPDQASFLSAVNENVKFTRLLSIDCGRLVRSILNTNPALRPQMYEIRQSPWLSQPMDTVGVWCRSDDIVNGNGNADIYHCKTNKAYGVDVKALFVSGVLRVAASEGRKKEETEEYLREDPLLKIGFPDEITPPVNWETICREPYGRIYPPEAQSYLPGMLSTSSQHAWQRNLDDRAKTLARDLESLCQCPSGRLANKVKEQMLDVKRQETTFGKNLRFKAAVLRVQRERLDKWRDVLRHMLASTTQNKIPEQKPAANEVIP